MGPVWTVVVPAATDWTQYRLPIPPEWFVAAGVGLIVVLTVLLLLVRATSRRQEALPGPAPPAQAMRRRSRVQTISPKLGAVAAYRASVTGDAGAAIEVMLGDPRVPAVSIFLNEPAQGLGLEVERWSTSKTPPRTTALPFNHLASSYLQLSLGSGKRTPHVVLLDLELAEEDAVDPEHLTILASVDGEWTNVCEVPLALEPTGRYHGQAAVPVGPILALAFNLSTRTDSTRRPSTPLLSATP